MLTLFSFRIVLPEVKRIRGVIVLGILLSVFACLMRGIGSEFALKKSFGFFVYFIAGYRMAELPKGKIGKAAARIALMLILFILIAISWKSDWYSMALSVLSRGANVDSFSHWYIAPATYLLVFISTSIVMILVMNAIPEQFRWLEKHGMDTMPMYLSHLILFMVVGYLVVKNNWIKTVSVSVLCIAISLVLFTADWYKRLFNGAIVGIKGLVFK